MSSPCLRELQESFFAFVAGPAEVLGPDGRGALARNVVRGAGPLDADARLRIYRGMCLARLVEVLRDDYAAEAERLGREAFDELAREYVVRNPSVLPSVRHVSAGFPEFLEDGLPDRPDLAESARVARARLEVFAETDPRPLTLERLKALPPERWIGLELRPIAALRVLTCAWAIEGPGALPRAHVLRVWRQGFEIFESTVDPVEARALDRLLTGTTTLEALGETLATTMSQADAAREAGGLLLRWLEDGILAAPAGEAS